MPTIQKGIRDRTLDGIKRMTSGVRLLPPATLGRDYMPKDTFEVKLLRRVADLSAQIPHGRKYDADLFHIGREDIIDLLPLLSLPALSEFGVSRVTRHTLLYIFS